MQDQPEHLAMLALSPGWREYVAGRIDELESCKSGLWRGLRDAVNAAVRAAKQQNEEKQ